VYISYGPRNVALRPNTSLSPTWLVVETEDGRVQVRQRIEVNEPGRDQRIVARIGNIDLARKIMADKNDVLILTDDFALRDQAVSAVLVTNHPVRSLSCAHQARASGIVG
jgi:hypothetical protein